MSLQVICQILGVHRSSYYAWLKRPDSSRKKDNQRLLQDLKAAHQKSRGTYGAPRLTEFLKQHGHQCSRNRVARLMQKEGIFGCARRKFRPQGITNSRHRFPIAPRIFQVQNKATFPKRPNQIWVSDTTYIPTKEGWLYLTVQLDVFTRKIVGYSMTDHLKSEATWESMRNALSRQSEALHFARSPKLTAHSDRGVQYASDLYRDKLEGLGIQQSMSRSGNCYDNAYAESFFHTLKVELIHRQVFETRKEAKQEIRSYIEQWYNTERMHSGLGYLTPNAYEQQALAG